MTSETRREALAALAEVCESSGDIRMGQLLAHLGFLGEDQTGKTLWDIEDEELLAVSGRRRKQRVGPQRATRPYPRKRWGYDERLF